MDNQHRLITGYRELNESEILAMNEIKQEGGRLQTIISTMEDCSELNVDRRWLAIGKTHLQEGLMALTRAIAKPTSFVLVFCVLLTGCISPYKEASGAYIKAAHTEFRSPFGTNDSFAKMERCDGPDKVVLFYLEADFTNCRDLSREELYVWVHGYSQGQGGQVVSGLMNAAALGGVAAAAGSAGNAASSASSTVINNLPTRHHGHR